MLKPIMNITITSSDRNSSVCAKNYVSREISMSYFTCKCYDLRKYIMCQIIEFPRRRENMKLPTNYVIDVSKGLVKKA